jgi:predicted transcriptional regulator
VLYASSPVQRVIGEFVVADVLSMSPAALWRATRQGAGISREYFDHYFAGRTVGHAIGVKESFRFARPRHLEKHYGVRRPPQSFCYLD